MADNRRIGPTQEYDSLRAELLEAKRYVFERPLAIAAIAAAGIQFFDKPQHITLPLAISLLTLFNFWFTVNRLHSACRIAAYIQLVLEPSACHAWIGWETSLRKYRKWLNSKTTKEAREYVDKRLDGTAVPPALIYYRAIYYFHITLMLFAVFVALAGLQWGVSHLTWVLSLGAIAVGVWSFTYFRRWRPSRLKASIERNRVIWTAVLGTSL
jgi:hypothetical protein